jgi:hypothetical protein
MSVTKEENNNGFAVGKRNFLFIALGFLVVIIGFILMTGGGSADPTKFDPEMFNARRTAIAPVVVLIGYAFIGWAILKKPKE